ncbi:MAG: hypothetical protein NVV59_04420 [Chitinophagaceae bacterium]|nr:hypothetical protein [Chitinophagaceae bacterium]
MSPQELTRKTSEHIREALLQLKADSNPWEDSVTIDFTSHLDAVYSPSEYKAIWSQGGSWQPVADSFYRFIQNARLRGLFPENYHLATLENIRETIDSAGKKDAARFDAVQWAKADLLLSDAFFQVVTDLKFGRLPKDSLTARKDSTLAFDFYAQRLSAARQNQSLALAFYGLEPRHEGYLELLAALPNFLENAFKRDYTIVPSPKSGKDLRKRFKPACLKQVIYPTTPQQSIP